MEVVTATWLARCKTTSELSISTTEMVEIPHISFGKSKGITMPPLQPFQVSLASRTAQIVIDDDVMTLLQIMICAVAANKTSASSNEVFHFNSIPFSVTKRHNLNGVCSDYSELISAFINRLFLPYFPGAAETIPFPYGVRTIDKDGPRNLQTL